MKSVKVKIEIKVEREVETEMPLADVVTIARQMGGRITEYDGQDVEGHCENCSLPVFALDDLEYTNDGVLLCKECMAALVKENQEAEAAQYEFQLCCPVCWKTKELSNQERDLTEDDFCCGEPLVWVRAAKEKQEV